MGAMGGGGAGAGVDPSTIDPNAVGDSGGGGSDPFGSGGDPFGLGGGDMGFGGGGGGGDMSGGGRGPDTSAASVASTQLQAPYDIQAGGGLRAPGGGPATDQPRTYQNASAALMGGPQRIASRTTFGQAPQEPEELIPQDPSQDTPPYTGPASIFSQSDATKSEAWAPLPNTNLGAPDSFSSRFGASQPDASFNERFPGGATRGINIPLPATPDGSRPYPPESNVGGLPAIPRPYPPESNVGGLPAIPPQPSAPVPTPQLPPAAANIPLPQPRPVGAPSIQSVTPQATPPAASPAAAATGGQGVPGMGGLEQVVRQFLQMLGIGGGGGMGGVLSPLEHMLARALGINLPQPYPGFNPGFHSPFFQPPGPGQFPAGAVGGRSISPQPGSPPGAPPGPAPGPPGPPGPPGAPGNPPSALPPGRRLSDTSLPGGPWTAPSADQPPPWAAGQAGAGAGDATQFIRDRGGHPAGIGAPDLNPEFAQRLANAGRAYEQETGQKANFGEMGRSHALQRQYYQQYRRTGQGLAARPGMSRHERGLATDVPSGPFQSWLHQNASRFGLEGLRSRADPFHFQMAGRPTTTGTAPAAQRTEINPDSYERTFAGTPLAGQSDAITRAAKANGVPPARMVSIIAEETGRGRSNMLRTMNNPAGITREGHYVSFPTLQEGIDAAARAIGRVYQQAGGDIGRMGHIYAPPGARNDPYGTNRQWPGAVTRFEQSLGM